MITPVGTGPGRSSSSEVEEEEEMISAESWVVEVRFGFGAEELDLVAEDLGRFFDPGGRPLPLAPFDAVAVRVGPVVAGLVPPVGIPLLLLMTFGPSFFPFGLPLTAVRLS